jgi:hypothetical protein
VTVLSGCSREPAPTTSAPESGRAPEYASAASAPAAPLPPASGTWSLSRGQASDLITFTETNGVLTGSVAVGGNTNTAPLVFAGTINGDTLEFHYAGSSPHQLAQDGRTEFTAVFRGTLAGDLITGRCVVSNLLLHAGKRVPLVDENVVVLRRQSAPLSSHQP